MEALCGVVGAMAMAQALGAPVGALDAAVERLSWTSALLRGELLPVVEEPPAPSPEPVRTRPASIPPPPVIAQPQREVSVWDPETPLERIEVTRYRALLLEILKRAIHDWILYRNHSKLDMRARATSAHTWLFEEDADHPWFRQREREGHTIVAFLVICETCDLDPEYVRRRARETTVKQIMTAGRPAERRRPTKEVSYDEHRVDSINLEALEQPSGGRFTSSHEEHFAVSTPSYV